MTYTVVFFKELNVLHGFFPSFSGLRRLLFLLIFVPFSAQAVKVQFPDEELSSESVLPIVNPHRVILNRKISLKFRPELGLGMGIGLDEPFYDQRYPSGLLAFHLTEAHAISVAGAWFWPGLSNRGEKLRRGEGLREGHKFNALKAPYPQMSLFMNYQYSPYYGKISLAKNWVMYLSIYGFAGLGLIITDQNNRLPAVNVGIGEKLYINKWLGVRFDLGLYGYYGPATAKLRLDDGVGQVRYEELRPDEKRPIINVISNIGVIFLI